MEAWLMHRTQAPNPDEHQWNRTASDKVDLGEPGSLVGRLSVRGDAAWLLQVLLSLLGRWPLNTVSKLSQFRAGIAPLTTSSSSENA
jgi:hypothetical protein